MVRKRYERVMCERWVEQSGNILTPSSSGYNSTSFSFSWAVQPGALWTQPLLGLGSHSSNCNNWLQTLDSNKMTSCRTGLYNCLRSPASVSVASTPNSTRQQSRLSPDIFDRMHQLFTLVHFLFNSSAGPEVSMLHLLGCWRWRTILTYEILCLPDTLRVLLFRFALMALSSALESTVWGQHDLAWLSLLPSSNGQYSMIFQIRLRCIFAVSKSHMEWSNSQRVSAPTTKILPTTVGTYYCLNCISHVILQFFWLIQVRFFGL